MSLLREHRMAEQRAEEHQNTLEHPPSHRSAGYKRSRHILLARVQDWAVLETLPRRNEGILPHNQVPRSSAPIRPSIPRTPRAKPRASRPDPPPPRSDTRRRGTPVRRACPPRAQDTRDRRHSPPLLLPARLSSTPLEPRNPAIHPGPCPDPRRVHLHPPACSNRSRRNSSREARRGMHSCTRHVLLRPTHQTLAPFAALREPKLARASQVRRRVAQRVVRAATRACRRSCPTRCLGARRRPSRAGRWSQEAG